MSGKRIGHRQSGSGRLPKKKTFQNKTINHKRESGKNSENRERLDYDNDEE